MRTLAVFLLLCCALPCAAQHLAITDLDNTGVLTWEITTPLYCGVECKWNLQHTWLPWSEWNTLMTGGVAHATLDLDEMMGMIRNLCLSLDCEAPQGLFFRVVASSSSLDLPLATNLVHLANASTSVLANVEIGSLDSGTRNAITNIPLLAPASRSPNIPVVQEIPLPQLSPTNIIDLVQQPLRDGWYVSYEHYASNRIIESLVLPFGPLEKHVAVTVSNQSATASYEWVTFRHTLTY